MILYEPVFHHVRANILKMIFEIPLVPDQVIMERTLPAEAWGREPICMLLIIVISERFQSVEVVLICIK
jgi:hypothetical protein